MRPSVFDQRARPIDRQPAGQSFRDLIPTLGEDAALLTPEAMKRDFAALMSAVEHEPACGPRPGRRGGLLPDRRAGVKLTA